MRETINTRLTARFPRQAALELERACLALGTTRSELITAGTIAEMRRRLAEQTKKSAPVVDEPTLTL